MSSTPIFGITYPDGGDVGYMPDLISFFTEVETTIGQNCHLILLGDTGPGAGDAGDMGFISSSTVVQDADPASSRWGRMVLLSSLPNAADVAGVIMGLVTATGASGSFGDPLFHAASGDQLVTAVEDAVVDGTNRIIFLPVGMCVGSGIALFNGMEPLEVCPNIPAGPYFQYKDGSSNPTADITRVYSAGAWFHRATFDGAAQDIDAIFPIQVPADFGSFPDKAGAAFWGLRTRFFTHNNSSSGYAGAQITGFIDTAGVEHVALGTSLEQTGAWTDQVVGWQTLNGLAPSMTPGRTVFVRLKFRGNNLDTVDFETPTLQYFPLIRWN